MNPESAALFTTAMQVIFDATPDGMLLLSIDGTILAVNRTFAADLGISPHEAVGNELITFLSSHWESFESMRLADAVKTSTPLHFEATGDDRWFSVHFVPVTHEQTPTLRGALYVHNITEQRCTEDIVRAGEERFRHVLENSQVASYRWKLPEEQYDYFSPVIERLTGYSVDDITFWSKEHILTLVHPDDRPRFRHTFTKYPLQSRAYEVEYRFCCADGSYRWFSDAGTIVRNYDDSVLFHIGAIRDIEDQKAVERALRQSEERYGSLSEAAGDMIITVDLDGRTTFANEATRVFLGGFNPVGLNIRDFVPPDLMERQKDMIEQRRLGFTDHLLYEWRAISPVTGREIMTEVRSSLLTEEGKPAGVLFIARDISARKAIEAEREHLIDQLTEALSRIKTLRGLLPICASCKKIRNDEGYWEQVETYIMNHSYADFSHGLCPECAKKLYPEFVK